jgi:tungstate transport system ATP-binding protein
VALARAGVTADTALDEPTSNLDPASVSLIEALIRELREERGATIIMATHNLFQARRLATRVALLHQGELIEIAPTEQFFSHPETDLTRAFLSGEMIY